MRARCPDVMQPDISFRASASRTIRVTLRVYKCKITLYQGQMNGREERLVTRHLLYNMDKIKMKKQYWIFGYGSLIWNPNFRYSAMAIGYITGWERRFYQGSPDHRGTKDAPGRVVTVLPSRHKESKVWGVAYCLDQNSAEHVLESLDEREQAGYVRETLEFVVPRGTQWNVLCYRALPCNADYLGEATEEEIASHIAHSKGPSGTNIEYALKLNEALNLMNVDDSHVRKVAALLTTKHEISLSKAM